MKACESGSREVFVDAGLVIRRLSAVRTVFRHSVAESADRLV